MHCCDLFIDNLSVWSSFRFSTSSMGPQSRLSCHLPPLEEARKPADSACNPSTVLLKDTSAG